jgi:hypothetical protein
MTTTIADRAFWTAFDASEDEADAAIRTGFVLLRASRVLRATGSPERAERVASLARRGAGAERT